MMIVGVDQRVLADTLGIATGRPFAFPVLMAEAKASQMASAMVLIRGRLYQLVVVPILAPTPIGVVSVLAPTPTAWVAIGFAIDDSLAQDLRRLTRLHVSFLSRHESESWRLQASTLSDRDRSALLSNVAAERFTERDPDGNAHYSDDAVTRVIAFPVRSRHRVIAVLQQPLSSALEPFWRLQRRLTFISLAGIVVSILASVVIARRIARPVRQLVSVGRRIAAADTSTPPPPSG